MAIKNLIKAGTYTRISTINYDRGRLQSVQLVTYETTPTMTYKECRTETTKKVQELGPDGKTMIENDHWYMPEESVAVLQDIVIHGEKHGLDSLDIDPGKNLSTQVYTHLATLPLFAGTVSDE
jgi:hypothetical protein